MFSKRPANNGRKPQRAQGYSSKPHLVSTHSSAPRGIDHSWRCPSKFRSPRPPHKGSLLPSCYKKTYQRDLGAGVGWAESRGEGREKRGRTGRKTWATTVEPLVFGTVLDISYARYHVFFPILRMRKLRLGVESLAHDYTWARRDSGFKAESLGLQCLCSGMKTHKCNFSLFTVRPRSLPPFYTWGNGLREAE